VVTTVSLLELVKPGDSDSNAEEALGTALAVCEMLLGREEGVLLSMDMLGAVGITIAGTGPLVLTFVSESWSCSGSVSMGWILDVGSVLTSSDDGDEDPLGSAGGCGPASPDFGNVCSVLSPEGLFSVSSDVGDSVEAFGSFVGPGEGGVLSSTMLLAMVDIPGGRLLEIAPDNLDISSLNLKIS